MENNNELKRLLYLSEYKISNKDKKLLKEEIDVLVESRQTEQQALIILNDNNVNEPEALINDFKTVDTSKNQILLPLMAQTYIDHRNVNDIKSLFPAISELVKSGKIPVPQKTANGYQIKDKTFSDYLSLTEYIHGLESISKGHRDLTGEIKDMTDIATDEPPIFPREGHPEDENANIEIYDGNDIGKCINYTSGGITGQKYSFCIGQPGQSYWQGYRDTKLSTFYYIHDKNRDENDPLLLVVFDRTEHGTELTDKSNTTGNIAEFGNDADAYEAYLQSKGVPTKEILVNKEKSPEEIEDQKKLGSQNTDLDWFKNLSYKEQSKYIGRGHLLGDEQFEYLWQFKSDKGGLNLLSQYVDTGQAIPEAQFNILTGE